MDNRWARGMPTIWVGAGQEFVSNVHTNRSHVYIDLLSQLTSDGMSSILRLVNYVVEAVRVDVHNSFYGVHFEIS